MCVCACVHASFSSFDLPLDMFVCITKGLANKTKEQSDSLLATLLDQQTKLDMCSSDMKVHCMH